MQSGGFLSKNEGGRGFLSHWVEAFASETDTVILQVGGVRRMTIHAAFEGRRRGRRK